MSELRCRGTEVCCGLPDRVGFLAWNAGCGVYIESQCEAWASDTALRDGTLRWNEAEAQTLLDGLRTALATCSAISPPFDFSAVFEGTLAEGEDCTPGLPFSWSVGIFRCQGELRCDLIGNAGPGMFTGTCAPRGDEGDRCNYDCQAGLWCDGTIGDGGDPFMGHRAREEQPRCGRDLWCRSRFCDIPMRQCVEPEPRLTWCGYIG